MIRARRSARAVELSALLVRKDSRSIGLVQHYVLDGELSFRSAHVVVDVVGRTALGVEIGAHEVAPAVSALHPRVDEIEDRLMAESDPQKAGSRVRNRPKMSNTVRGRRRQYASLELFISRLCAFTRDAAFQPLDRVNQRWRQGGVSESTQFLVYR